MTSTTTAPEVDQCKCYIIKYAAQHKSAMLLSKVTMMVLESTFIEGMGPVNLLGIFPRMRLDLFCIQYFKIV